MSDGELRAVRDAKPISATDRTSMLCEVLSDTPFATDVLYACPRGYVEAVVLFSRVRGDAVRETVQSFVKDRVARFGHDVRIGFGSLPRGDKHILTGVLVWQKKGMWVAVSCPVPTDDLDEHRVYEFATRYVTDQQQWAALFKFVEPPLEAEQFLAALKPLVDSPRSRLIGHTPTATRPAGQPATKASPPRKGHVPLRKSDSAPADAGLLWDSQIKTAEVSEGDTSVEIRYGFSNKGSVPIRITGTKSSCSCAKVQYEPPVVRPGESGCLIVTMDLGLRQGLTTGKVVVQTDRGGADVITAAVNVPSLFKTSSAALTWVADDPQPAKELILSRTTGARVRIVKAVADRGGFGVSFTEIEPGRRYVVRVTPENTKTAVAGNLLLTTDYPHKQPKQFVVPLRVLPAVITEHRR